MGTVLSSKHYLHLAQVAVKFSAVLFLLLFAVLSYHRTMIGMYAESNGTMQHTTSAAEDNCLTLCLTASSIFWTNIVTIIQTTLVKAFSVFTALVVLAVIIAKVFTNLAQRIQSDRLIRLLLYAKRHWQVRLFCWWSQLFSQGIIASKLYA